MENVIKLLAAELKRFGVLNAFNFPGFYSSMLFDEFNNRITSTNEATAYAAAWGASQGGEKSMVCFRDLGMNVAADAYINSLYTGVGAGLIAVVFSDQSFEGSQCLINVSNYASFGGLWIKPLTNKSIVVSAGISVAVSEIFNIPTVIEITNGIHYTKDETSKDKLHNIYKLINSYRGMFEKQKPIAHPVYAFDNYALLYRKNSALLDLSARINELMDEAFLYVVPMQEISTRNKPDISNYVTSVRYESLFLELKKHFDVIVGDIGEYTNDTLSTITHTLSFGASIAVAMGFCCTGKDVAVVVGDGAFFSSAKSSICEVLERGQNIKIVLIDNAGMFSTGGQRVPGELPSNVDVESVNMSSVSKDGLISIVNNLHERKNTMILHCKYT